MKSLYESLEAYSRLGIYPAHMPGHKRQKAGELPEAFTEADITEIEGFDNLQHPAGILRRLQEQAADLFGADESFYLVNGSTGGILSAISTAVPVGGHLLMARGCHQSVYHGAYLRRLRLSFLYPERVSGFPLEEAISAEQVKEMLRKCKDVSAVIIVSPTYEGRIADVRAIADVVHERGIPLIVDEAHGAHLGFSKEFSQNSCRQGADLVVHSVHKTLPALTQTALLHVNGTLIHRNLLRRFLNIYQTSSPSYLLMAGIDNAVRLMKKEGMERGRQFYCNWERMLTQCSKMEKLKILPIHDRRQDIGKLVIFTEKISLSPHQLYDMLLQEYRIQLEMAGSDYVLAMFTIWDTEEGFQRMTEALLDIDQKVRLSQSCEQPMEEQNHREAETLLLLEEQNDRRAETYLPLHEAWDCPWEECLLEEAEGKIAADFIGAYPPGIPLLVPGERFLIKDIHVMNHILKQGISLAGIYSREDERESRNNLFVHILKDSCMDTNLFPSIVS